MLHTCLVLDLDQAVVASPRGTESEPWHVLQTGDHVPVACVLTPALQVSPMLLHQYLLQLLDPQATGKGGQNILDQPLQHIQVWR